MLMFSAEVKTRYQEHSEHFAEIETCVSKHSERFRSRFVSQPQRPQRLLGHNASALLQKLLNRSRYLLRGFILSFNDSNAIMAYLATRSHFETTGAIACLLKWLQKFYNERCNYEELDGILKKLYLGGRVFPDKNIPKYSCAPDSINVLSLIDDVDVLYKHMSGDFKKPFRENYEFLSEYCHPNFLGINQGSKAIMPQGIFEFQYPPTIDNSEATDLLANLTVSLSMFMHFFDKCYELLHENEEMPILEK